MIKLYSPGDGFFVSSRRPALCFLLLLGCGLLGCSPGADSSSNGHQAPPPPSPPATGSGEQKKLSADLEQLKKDIQPEGPAVAVAEKEPVPERKPVETPPGKPGESVKAAPPPPETVKAPEPAKTPAAPPEGVDEKKLLNTLKNRMILFGRAFESGNLDEIKKFLIVDDDLKAILTDGGYNILGVSLEAQNEEAVTQTLKAIRDAKFEYEFVPGRMTYTPNNSIFKKKVPTMSQSKMLFKIDGTPVPFIFYIKQLVWFGENWKVFNAGI